ncbi:cell surface glycoprotein CD200 receptor 1-like [Pelobates fuscus]|uniref:cell surface glycoprotein CD200 receptor 1-like n=1 Tax=Pelobates fuscus TaxID=191477 RepID=UPI002FE43D85
MQQVTKYPLLLENIIKNTEAGSEEMKDLPRTMPHYTKRPGSEEMKDLPRTMPHYTKRHVVVSVVAGSVGILHCAHYPGDAFIMITWRVHSLYTAPCLMSMQDNKTFTNCTERAIQDNVTLKIMNTEITDTGIYTCEVVNAEGTFINTVLLQVLVPPSVSLMINRDGSPECRAVGGNPAADISWIPESDSVNTTSRMEPDKTWTVISTYSAHGISGREVKCKVSHPAFTHPQIMAVLITGNIHFVRWIVGPVILLVLITGLLFTWKRPTCRCSK